MARNRNKSGSIASNILRVTLGIGVLTIVAALIVALYTTSRLSAALASSVGRGYLQEARSTFEARLEIVDEVGARVAAAAAQPNPSVAALDAALASGRGWVDLVAVTDATGRMLSVSPTATGASPIQPRIISRALARGLTYVEASGTVGGPTREWLVRTVGLRNGELRVALVRLKKTFAEDALAGAGSTATNSILVIGPGRPARIIASTGSPVVDTSIVWRADPLGGQFSGRGADGRLLMGYVTNLPAWPGLEWRIAAMQPASSAVIDTLKAVSPVILVLAVGGLAALALAWLTSYRLVTPLRQLERSALRAAAGTYAEPVDVEREDEIGRVADAFNAVALRLNALRDVSQLLASTAKLDTVLDGVLNAIPHIVGPGVTAIYLLDEAGEKLELARAQGVAGPGALPLDVKDKGWLARALDTAEPTIFQGSAEELKKELGGLQVESSGSAVAVRLSVGRDPLGIVTVVPASDTPLDDAQMEMLRTFSAQASVAVNTSRLFSQESEARSLSDGLRRIAEDLAHPGALTGGLDRIEDTLRDLLGAKWVRFAIADRQIIGAEPATDAAEEESLLEIARGASKQAPGDRHPLLALDVADPAVAGLLENHGGRVLLLAPIGLETDHGAVLAMALEQGDLEEHGREVVDAVVDEVDLALENAYLFGRAVTRAANLETVFRISQVLGSSLQVNVVLNRVLDVVQKIFAADAVALMTYDPDRRVLASDMARGAVPPAVLELALRPGEDIPGYVFASGEPAVFRDLHGGMGGLAGAAAGAGMRSLIAVPLLARGHPIGVLTAFSADLAAFSEEDVNLFRTFASQAALAVDTARMYSREHQIARTLQQSIRPERLPAFPGLDTGTAYVPTGLPGADIGGDYYDMMLTPDGRAFLAIGDVCGKGIEAATKTSMIRYSVRALVAAGFSPARVLSELNRIVCSGGETSDIVTLWVGMVDAEGGRVVWADGGHPPALLRRSSGELEHMGPTGPLLGAISTATYGEGEQSLGVGDYVVLYTDGVTEARRGNIFFGEDRLRQSLGSDGSAQDVADRVLGAVRRFVRGDLRDDVAVLTVARRMAPTAEKSTDERASTT